MRPLTLTLASLLLALSAPAQVTLIRGSGCAGTSKPLWRGSPKLNVTFRVFCPVGGIHETPYAVLGAPLVRPIMVHPPVSCRAACALSTIPILLIPLGTLQPTLTVQIPNAPALIGTTTRVQCAALQRTPRCFDLRGAVDVRITR